MQRRGPRWGQPPSSREQPLGLAERVGAERRRPARRGVLLPPVHDVRGHRLAEGQSNEAEVLSVSKTSRRLEGRAGGVVLGLVVATTTQVSPLGASPPPAPSRARGPRGEARRRRSVWTRRRGASRRSLLHGSAGGQLRALGRRQVALRAGPRGPRGRVTTGHRRHGSMWKPPASQWRPTRWCGRGRCASGHPAVTGSADAARRGTCPARARPEPRALDLRPREPVAGEPDPARGVEQRLVLAGALRLYIRRWALAWSCASAATPAASSRAATRCAAASARSARGARASTPARRAGPRRRPRAGRASPGARDPRAAPR